MIVTLLLPLHPPHVHVPPFLLVCAPRSCPLQITFPRLSCQLVSWVQTIGHPSRRSKRWRKIEARVFLPYFLPAFDVSPDELNLSSPLQWYLLHDLFSRVILLTKLLILYLLYLLFPFVFPALGYDAILLLLVSSVFYHNLFVHLTLKYIYK